MNAPSAKLRILETTDLHMQVLPFDYFANSPAPGSGLVQAAQLIHDIRADGIETLLFDNGDFAQGNPLADHLAATLQPSQPHPMITAMNVLGYDAACLGNHEFDYGLDYLRRVIAGANFPILCANVHASNASLVDPSVILRRQLTLSDGTSRQVAIGVVGLTPPQVTTWNNEVLGGHVSTSDMIDAGLKAAANLRANGADIVVALCHSGIDGVIHHDRMENAIIPLAQTAQFDAILAGHTHELFPSGTSSSDPSIDVTRGKIYGIPVVQAGFNGQYIGDIALGLTFTDETWVVSSSMCRLHKVPTQNATCEPALQIAQMIAPFHDRCLVNMAKPIARTDTPIQSHFALISGDVALQNLAFAQMETVRAACPDQNWSTLPLLSAVSPILAGGRAGPQHYVDIPVGDITLRDAAAIYPFANTVHALEMSGNDLAIWLERAVGMYREIDRNKTRQNLLRADCPSYNFDVIYGLNYQIDLSKRSGRIGQMSYQGNPIRPTDRVVVATNSYRASGGGGLLRDLDIHVRCNTGRGVRDALIEGLNRNGPLGHQHSAPWTFAPLDGARAQFLTALTADPTQANGRDIHATGRVIDGFAQFEIVL